MFKKILLIMVMMVFASSAGAHWHPEKKDFPIVFSNGDTNLQLRGVGMKRFMMMRILEGGFYLDPEIPSMHALDDVPKHLEVRFFICVPSGEFIRYISGHIKANVDKKEFETLQERLKRFGALFPDVAVGDMLALNYEPGRGLTLTHNGQNRGTIEGADFAKAIFSTWIGPRPFDHIMKRKVLGLTS